KEVSMRITKKDVTMMRLVNQATAQGLAVAQHSQTRETLLFAPAGEVHRHPNVSLVRSWLRHYANCGRYGSRCFAQTESQCSGAAVPLPVFALGCGSATVLGGVPWQARRERRWKGWRCQ